MVSFKIKTRNGDEVVVNSAHGRSLMEVARESGIDELIALCGGSCACATCHVYAEDAFIAKGQPITLGEDDLLDSCEYRTSASRLSCQIRVTEELEGMTFTVAPEE